MPFQALELKVKGRVCSGTFWSSLKPAGGTECHRPCRRTVWPPGLTGGPAGPGGGASWLGWAPLSGRPQGAGGCPGPECTGCPSGALSMALPQLCCPPQVPHTWLRRLRPHHGELRVASEVSPPRPGVWLGGWGALPSGEAGSSGRGTDVAPPSTELLMVAELCGQHGGFWGRPGPGCRPAERSPA